MLREIISYLKAAHVELSNIEFCHFPEIYLNTSMGWIREQHGFIHHRGLIGLKFRVMLNAGNLSLFFEKQE